MLQRVSIQNFKSLKDVTLDLQKVNLLIGPNNSGKTNFLKALELMLSKLNLKGKTIDLPENVGFMEPSPLGPIASDITLYAIFDNPFNKGGFEHYIILKNEQEYVLWHNSLSSLEFWMPDYKNNDSAFNIFASSYNNVRIYNIDVNTLSKPFPLLPSNEMLNKEGSNLVAFLDTLRDKYPDNFFRIQDDLKSCVSEFSQIRFDNVSPSEELRKLYGDKTYKLLGLYDKNIGSTFWSNELSEGTLYFLAILSIVNQPIPPKLILLEEPEKGIHPRRIHEVMNFVFRLAEEKNIQIILTTHNENILNYFSTSPESVFVFDKNEDGATKVRNLKRDIIDPSHQRSRENGFEPINYIENLGENWMYGILGGVPEETL